MKNTIIIILLLVGNLSIAWSQTPQGINYQAVARDAAGACISNQNISVRINLRDSSATGILLYQEEHLAIPTNEQGLFSLTIGADASLATGAGQTMDFSTIYWTHQNRWLEIEMDPSGGSSFVIVGSQQLWTVPYAMSAGNGKEFSNVDQDEFFQTLGSNGSVNVSLDGSGTAGNINNGSLNAMNENGDIRSKMYSNADSSGGIGGVILYGSNGSENINLEGNGTAGNNGSLSALNENGEVRSKIYSSADSPGGIGRVTVYGPNGSENINLQSQGLTGDNANNGFLNAMNENGEVRSSLYSSGNVPGGVGALILYGSNGSFNHIMGTLSGADPDRGATSIRNQNGTTRISHYINSSDQGVKNFVAAHPEDPTKQIWYASLEGPEAAAYERGSARLVNGESTVNFSDHYRLIVNSNTLTVQLTPLSADSKGMAVIEITENGFKVKELQKGVGNYSFHWRVEGVRKGCEDFEVVRDKPRNELMNGVKKNLTNK